MDVGCGDPFVWCLFQKPVGEDEFADEVEVTGLSFTNVPFWLGRIEFKNGRGG